MKSIIAILLTVVLLMLCACGRDSAEPTDTVGGVASQSENTTKSEPTTSETQPSTDATVPEEDAPSFSPEKVSVWGLDEPSFAYSFIGYYVFPRGMSADGVNPNLHPSFIYRTSGDYATTYAYAQQISNAGWGDLLHEADDISPFAYTGTKGDYKVMVRWESDNTVTIRVSDFSKLAQWDEDAGAHVITDYGAYSTYGEYNPTLEGS